MSIEWFSAIADAFGPALEDRDRTLAAAPAVLAAIGAIGHSLTSINDPAERAARRAELVDRLRPVQWHKDKTWEGIAGKFSPKGTFSVGGSKETAYAVYAALTDHGNPGFKRVRGEVLAA